MITNQRDLRRSFWEAHPGLSRRKITNYAGTGKMHVTDTRVAFVDYVDYLSKDNMISEELADRATLD
jgi:hypothetical protein